VDVARIAIVTDSTSDLPADLAARHGITVVPLNVHFGNEVFRDQIDITIDQFMERLQRAPELPKTSQPSAGLFEQTFRELATDHDAILAVLISAKLSGTLQSATLARDAIGDRVPVEIVDSGNASLGLGFQAIHAAELARDGQSLEVIARTLRAETPAYHLLFFVDTLEYLQRGGRIGRAAALAGSVLKLKPILRLDEGQIVPHERTRTRAKAIDGLREFVRGLPHVERLAVLHVTTPVEAEQLAADLAVAHPGLEPIVARFGPVVGTHTGPGTLGVSVYEGEVA
jgi:DegV family protein with EDD domain